jgi:serine/threonine-protein kinase
MGVVYLGEHKNLGTKAAIKLIAPELSSKPDLLNRFFDEARAAALVDHPGVVKVFDCDIDPASGRAFIVMEYLEGQSLRQRLQEPPRLSVGEAARLTREIAAVLRKVHEIGIVHRDLKPDNVFLVAGGRSPSEAGVRILDFGVAKLGTSLNRQFAGTLEGSLLGTPAYMSPEQCRGAIDLDAKTDVYALGCMLFEMIAGFPPFRGDGLGELMSAHLTTPPPSLSSLGLTVNPQVEALIARSLAKAPADRPTVQDVTTTLAPHADAATAPVPVAVKRTQMMSSEPTNPSATRVLGGKATTLGGSAGTIEPRPPAQQRPPARGQSRRGAAILLGLAAVVAGVVIFRAVSHRQQGAGADEGRPTTIESSAAAPSVPAPAPAPAPAARAPEATAVPAEVPATPAAPPSARSPADAGAVTATASIPESRPRRRAQPPKPVPVEDRLPIE